MSYRRRVAFPLIWLTLLVTAGAPIARAQGHTWSTTSVSAEQEGVTTDYLLGADAVARLPQRPGDDGTSPVQAVAGPGTPYFVYRSETACDQARPGSANAPGRNCAAAIAACSNPPNGPGPLTSIYRQLVTPPAQPDPSPAAWQLVGSTCFSATAPGSRPTITMAMIQQAFNTTPWAAPVITTQPKGDVTLVTLDTYFKVNWSAAGFQPGEVEAIDPALMLGFQVQIRPRLVHFTYLFGDGESFGPTPSEGGVYPTGTITHRYAKAGQYPARVETTFGADFRVNGSEWTPIPDTVTVPGPTTTVTVRTARAVLVNR